MTFHFCIYPHFLAQCLAASAEMAEWQTRFPHSSVNEIISKLNDKILKWPESLHCHKPRNV